MWIVAAVVVVAAVSDVVAAIANNALSIITLYPIINGGHNMWGLANFSS